MTSIDQLLVSSCRSMQYVQHITVRSYPVSRCIARGRSIPGSIGFASTTLGSVPSQICTFSLYGAEWSLCACELISSAPRLFQRQHHAVEHRHMFVTSVGPDNVQITGPARHAWKHFDQRLTLEMLLLQTTLREIPPHSHEPDLFEPRK